MPNYICTTCGTQFAETDQPPEECAICLDERQYVGWNGQQWTTLDELRQSFCHSIKQVEPGLVSLGMEPKFAIGQRAFLITSSDGNVLWDCIPLLDEGLLRLVEAAGGISAIAISHPHFYSNMVDWSRAFDAPVYLHAADRRWVMRSDHRLEFWDGETKPLGSLGTLIRCGGHFDGGTVLHWPQGAEGKGVLLSGDIIQVMEDRRWLSFMYSYPNFIPLPASAVKRVADSVAPFDFDRIYGAFWGKIVVNKAQSAVRMSANRYIRTLTQETKKGTSDGTTT